MECSTSQHLWPFQCLYHTPLLLAAQGGEPMLPCLRLLLEAGVDINATDDTNGDCVFSMAGLGSFPGCWDDVVMLTKAGARASEAIKVALEERFDKERVAALLCRRVEKRWVCQGKEKRTCGDGRRKDLRGWKEHVSKGERGEVVVVMGVGQEESREDDERKNKEPEIEDLSSEHDNVNQVIKIHRQDLQIAADKLEAFVKNYEQTSVDVNKSIEDLAVALSTKEHPFSNINVENNFFEEVVSFSKEYTPGLLYFVTRHINTPGRNYTYKTVIQVATIFGTFVRNLNPGHYDAMHKWLAIVLQSCGLTINGLKILCTMGITEGDT